MTLKIGDIGYIEGDSSRPALVLGFEKDADGNDLVRYEPLTGTVAAKDKLTTHADAHKGEQS